MMMFAGLSLLLFVVDPETAIPLTSNDVLQNIQWIRAPEPDAVAQYQPELASMIGVSGRVIVRCEAPFEGTPQNCVAISSEPDGLGFDDAAKLVVATGRIKPAMVNGEPRNAKFNVTINFESLPIPSEADALLQGSEPSPKAMELARQIVRQYPPEVEAPSWESAIEQLDSDRQPPVRAWIYELFPFDLQEETERIAMALARSISEGELQLFLTMGAEPSPSAIERFDSVIAIEDTESLQALQTLRSRYCARWSCEIDRD